MRSLIILLLSTTAAIAQTQPLVPDDKLTPGVIASSDASVVCVSNPGATYSETHRHTTAEMKAQVFKEYGLAPHQGRSYEIVHRIPLALGGADDIRNLWPQQGWQHPSYHDKDRLEVYLWRSVCKHHTMELDAAQKLLLGNWIDAYKQVFNQEP